MRRYRYTVLSQHFERGAAVAFSSNARQLGGRRGNAGRQNSMSNVIKPANNGRVATDLRRALCKCKTREPETTLTKPSLRSSSRCCSFGHLCLFQITMLYSRDSGRSISPSHGPVTMHVLLANNHKCKQQPRPFCSDININNIKKGNIRSTTAGSHHSRPFAIRDRWTIGGS